ncbi:MAG: DOMON-like domain-containing protein [Prochlorococcaceae cyanobacterium]|jgi:hypothetical protein
MESSHPTAGSCRFVLLPFEVQGGAECFRLGGTAQRRDGVLHLRYALEGPLDLLLLPDRAPEPRRLDGLWEHTCLEAFLAPAGDPEAYWELNVSPSGDWNLYRLQGYRLGLEPEPAAAVPSLESHPSAAAGLFDVRCSLPAPLAEAPLQLGVTAVLEHRSGALSYWALHHPGPEADFHRRDSFLLKL